MSIFEYNEEETMRLLREDERRQGEESGFRRGEKSGFQRGEETSIITTCKDLGVSFIDTVERIADKFNLTQQEAEKRVQKYW